MYNFIDVNEASESVLLPSEALKINGEYIENQISGYRTLSVSGRESFAPELSVYETGVRDGSKLKSRRIPARTLVVRYQLIAGSNEAFREAYNQLAGILNVTEAELIFADEEDKFFIGTPSAIGEVEPGLNSVVGEFEIYCADPFKYSVIEYVAEAAAGSSNLLIDYNGTYKGYPILEADFFSETDVASDGVTAGTLTGAGDCGYVAFFTEDEKIIQLGDPEEADLQDGLAKSQTLMNQTFLSNTAWGTTAKELWAVNEGHNPATVTQTGSVAMKVATTEVEGAKPKSTSGTLLKVTSKADSPEVKYTVKYKTSERAEKTVKVEFTITTALGSSGSYMLEGYGLEGHVYIGGAWKSVTLKKESEKWKGKTGHTANLEVTVSGLDATTTALTGIKFKATRTDNLGKAGTLAETTCPNIAISKYDAGTPATYYLTASSYGTAANKWHGPSIIRTLSADASGVVGATDFTLTYKQLMCIGKSNPTKQMGGFHCHLSTSTGANVAGVRVVKTKAGRAASLMLYVNGVKVHQVGIDMSYGNPFFGYYDSSVKTSTITKSGNKLTFNIGGYSKVITDDAIADLAVVNVTFMFEQYSNKAALSYNGLYWAKFVKNNCATYKEIPNKFSANDVVTADCKSGDVHLNGVLTPELGALGNDWEGFYLSPGLNPIGFSYSEWVETDCAPTIKVRYREVFL